MICTTLEPRILKAPRLILSVHSDIVMVSNINYYRYIQFSAILKPIREQNDDLSYTS